MYPSLNTLNPFKSIVTGQFVGAGFELSDSLARAMDDIYEMRMTGHSFAVFEMRDSMLHIDDMVIEAIHEDYGETTVQRVNRTFWAGCAKDFLRWFSMFGFVFAGMRYEAVSAHGDVIRPKNEGSGKAYSAKHRVATPFVFPYKSVRMLLSVDKKGRECIVPVDEQGKLRSDVYVFRARSGGVRILTGRFETECGALLDEWRMYKRKRELHDRVVQERAKPTPFIEHMSKNDQTRLEESANSVHVATAYGDVITEDGVPPQDAFGRPIEQDIVLKKHVPQDENKAKAFVDIPPNRRVSAVQVRPEADTNIENEHKRWMGLLTATLQVPQRYLQIESSRGLGASGNEATVEDDMQRAVRNATHLCDEITDCVLDFYTMINDVRPSKVSIPTATHLTPTVLYSMYDRGMLEPDVLAEEMARVVGVKRARVRKPFPPEPPLPPANKN